MGPVFIVILVVLILAGIGLVSLNARDTIPCYCWSKTPPSSGRPTAAMVVRDACPGCGSTPFKKSGHMHSGKQNHRCRVCGRQFVTSAEERIISDQQRALIEHLLCERISLRGICRAVGVSLTWLLHLMVERFAACPDH
jgi:transposase-like protein